MKISITESAYQDLADIHEHYMLEGIEHIGKKHVNEVFSKIDILNDHPQIGRIVPEYGLISLREIIHPPYRIVYSRIQIISATVMDWRGGEASC